MKIKFITLNILHGGVYFDNVVKFIHDEKPDIIVLQEVYESKNEMLEKRFRTFEEFGMIFKEDLPYSAFQSAFFNITEIEEGAEHGNAVFSKFEITKNEKVEINAPYAIVDETGMTDYSHFPSVLQCVEIQTPEKKLNVFNLHGIWGFDGEDNPKRIEMAHTIARMIEGKENVILAGDTNFTPKATDTIRIIENAHVKSIFGDELMSTFNMAHKDDEAYATASVDMIFVSPTIQVIKKELSDADVSDHRALIAILEI